VAKRFNILIAYDGSGCADAALDDLKVAGLPTEADATVLTVTEVWLPPQPPSSSEIVDSARAVHVPADLKKVYVRASEAVEEAKAIAAEAGNRIQSLFPRWNVQTEATYGSPSWEIINRASDLKSDLVVVGSHGRSALGRLFIGSVSQKVANESTSSVRVARGRIHEPDEPARIIVGIDGSAGSKIAVSSICSRLWPSGSEVRVIAVEDPLVPTAFGYFIPPVDSWIEEINLEDRSWLQRVVELAAEELSQSGLKAVPEIIEGDPKRALLEEAEKWGADSIFLGSTGFTNRLERILLGSVSSAVVARAHCSVEVARIV
jgi:nucleotide-binding universal stress UspA family protein